MSRGVGPRKARLLLWVTGVFLLVLAAGVILARAGRVADLEASRGRSGDISSGFLVGGFEYDPDPADPSYIESITFTIAPMSGALPPRQVRLSGDGGVHWATCTPLRGSSWICLLHAPLHDLTALRVVVDQ